MSANEKPPIRIVTAADTVWEEASHGPEEAEAPGRESAAADSPDEKPSAGWWERDEQRRPFARAFHEVAISPVRKFWAIPRARLTCDRRWPSRRRPSAT